MNDVFTETIQFVVVAKIQTSVVFNFFCLHNSSVLVVNKQ